MIDTTRHISVFDPDTFQHPVHVVGCGATGSRIALELARLGIREIHLWDDDVIEQHNIANQIYLISEIGKNKAIALWDAISSTTCSYDTSINEEKVTDQQLNGVVFLLTDTMSSRKEIWTNCIKLRFNVPLMIETRMDVDSFRIYSVCPTNIGHIVAWEKTLYNDDEAEESACGARTTIGATAEIISGLAIWELIKWHKDQSCGLETIMSLVPEPMIINRKL